MIIIIIILVTRSPGTTSVCFSVVTVNDEQTWETWVQNKVKELNLKRVLV